MSTPFHVTCDHLRPHAGAAQSRHGDPEDHHRRHREEPHAEGIALVFGVIGFLYNPFLVFIALLIWMGASGESLAVQTRSVLAGIPVTHAMMTDFRTLDAGESLQRAVALVLAGAQRDFPVTENGRLAGVLTRDTLVSALASGHPDIPVGQVMSRAIQTADHHELLDAAFRRLQGCQCHVLPVLRSGQVVGLLTPENVGEFIMFRGVATSVPAVGPASAS